MSHNPGLQILFLHSNLFPPSLGLLCWLLKLVLKGSFIMNETGPRTLTLVHVEGLNLPYSG